MGGEHWPRRWSCSETAYDSSDPGPGKAPPGPGSRFQAFPFSCRPASPRSGRLLKRGFIARLRHLRLDPDGAGRPLIPFVRPATDAVSWRATLCVPAMNRIDGPRPKAAGAPTKYKPGTVDSAARLSTGYPLNVAIRARRSCRQVSQPGEVDAESRSRRSRDRPRGSIGSDRRVAAARRFRWARLPARVVFRSMFDHAFDAGLQPPCPERPQDGPRFFGPHALRQPTEGGRRIPERALPPFAEPVLPDPYQRGQR